MGSEKSAAAEISHQSVLGLHAKHQKELESLTLFAQPYRTITLFVLAIIQYLKRSVLYLLAHNGWFILLSVIIGLTGVLIVTIDGPHGKHIDELREYLQFGFWWVALGVASSIGLGSGLHTFVLYLGPHIALFTIKAVQCGRVDIKNAPYDTIQLKRSPSWLDKDCSEFGPPLISYLDGSTVPLGSILPQVQLEAVLWGLGTALGELPPYFISRAASLSGGRVDTMEKLEASSTEDNGFMGTHLNRIKRWLLSHAQFLNFFTILILASVPNPLFDLAGIMCGQFGISFWKFFFATLIGKAIIKTHIQTIFIISVCNNQLLHWIENELIWVFSHIPGFASVLPHVVTKLHAIKDKYMVAKPIVPSNVKAKSWGVSFSTLWNTIIWIMILNFSVKIVTATAQRYLKKQQDKEMDVLKNMSSTTQ